MWRTRRNTRHVGGGATGGWPGCAPPCRSMDMLLRRDRGGDRSEARDAVVRWTRSEGQRSGPSRPSMNGSFRCEKQTVVSAGDRNDWILARPSFSEGAALQIHLVRRIVERIAISVGPHALLCHREPVGVDEQRQFGVVVPRVQVLQAGILVIPLADEALVFAGQGDVVGILPRDLAEGVVAAPLGPLASGVGNSDADRRRSGNSVLKRLSRDQKLTVIPMVFINFRGDTPCRFSASGSAPAFTSFEINV